MNWSWLDLRKNYNGKSGQGSKRDYFFGIFGYSESSHVQIQFSNYVEHISHLPQKYSGVSRFKPSSAFKTGLRLRLPS